MTIRTALNSGSNKLKNKSTSPSLDAEVLLAFILKKDRTYLATNPNKTILPGYQRNYTRLISKRMQGWPVAHLTGRKEFYGRDFLVTKDVLIPRPETEGLVDLVLDNIKDTSGLKILDVGTGSGCIIISLASILSPRPSHRFLASDISKKALAIAKQNAKKHRVKINFKHSDLLNAWQNEKMDIILANLPYGWLAWKNNTSAETKGLKFEPYQALYTKNHGLFLIEKLFRQTSNLIPTPSTLVIEFDPRQSKQIKKLAAKLLPAYKIKIMKDLSGRDRYGVLTK